MARATKPKNVEACALRRQQARRLELVRHMAEIGVQQAADMAGVSRFTWFRYEKAEADIECVPLARFVRSLGLPAEYVVTGSFAGLDDAAVRRLVEIESLETLAAAEGKELVIGPVRRGRKRQKRTEHSATAGTLEN